MAVISPGDVVCVRAYKEVRGRNGLLLNPPKLFVVHDDEENDRLSFEPISWTALQNLAPEKHRRIADEISASRDERFVAPGFAQ